MQTFLPYQNYHRSAKVLDNKRLGKQRVEVLQILNVLTDDKKIGWLNHPAVKMWRGYEFWLRVYGRIMCEEWISRGFKDTCMDKIAIPALPTDLPWWSGYSEFHAAHRANLLRKDETYYRQFGWTEQPTDTYYWPLNDSKQFRVGNNKLHKITLTKGENEA